MDIRDIFKDKKIGSEVTVSGWIKSHRKQANYGFIDLNDGSCFKSVLIVFEREITLTNSIWTGLAPLPSCLYWLVYLILSLTKLWEEPYELASKINGVKGLLLEIFTLILIPIVFILVSFLLWQIK